MISKQSDVNTDLIAITVRVLWLAAKQALFFCNDRALLQ